MPLSTLQATPCGATCKTEGQDGVAVSFPVGLFHSLQHAGLTRRSLINGKTAELVWLSASNVGSLSSTIFYAQRNSATSFTTPVQVASTSNEVNCFSAFVEPSTGKTDVGW